MEVYMEKYSEDYKKGYVQAMNNLNTYQLVIQENWNPSRCPNCNEDFGEFETCNDGYWDRAFSLSRCPYCGQALYWDKRELEFLKKFYPDRFRQYSIEDFFRKKENNEK